jgi:hypothetical protein
VCVDGLLMSPTRRALANPSLVIFDRCTLKCVGQMGGGNISYMSGWTVTIGAFQQQELE